MTNPAPSLSPRQRMLLRRGGIALIIYTLAVIVIVQWENVRHLLFVPYYPLFLALFAIGGLKLGQHSRAGRWAFLGWGMAVAIVMLANWVGYRSIMSDQVAPGDRLNWLGLWGRTMLWLIGGVMAIGIGLALWGWVLYFRGHRLSTPSTRQTDESSL